MYFTIIIPVYNRPDEVEDLLTSLTQQKYSQPFEVLIVEDGSTVDSKRVVEKFEDKLSISYHFKHNTGPGDSRNYAMRHARGDYFLILDSDCILPEDYLTNVERELAKNYVDCFGGVDDALSSFSNLQKAINFAMTSPLTTGGVRGGSERLGKFQPRSFNMGLSKRAFEASGGFGTIHPGEDPDLSIRLWELGFNTYLFPSVKVFHKRRISWEKYYTQVNKFGKVRPILDLWHPQYFKPVFLLPSLFVFYFVTAIILALFSFISALFLIPLGLLIAYLALCGTLSGIQNRSISIGYTTIRAVIIQFWGYGVGYILSFWKLRICRKKPQEAFPELFFNRTTHKA